MKNENLNLAFLKLEKALITLEKAKLMPFDEDRSEKDTSIKRFEYTFELFWKTLKKILESEGFIDLNSPKAILSQAFMSHLIINEDIWLDMLADRNLSSHTYNEDLADAIFSRIRFKYTDFLRTSFDNLRAKCTQNEHV